MRCLGVERPVTTETMERIGRLSPCGHRCDFLGGDELLYWESGGAPGLKAAVEVSGVDEPELLQRRCREA